MDKDQFTASLVAAILGSGLIRRNLNTWGIGSLLKRAKDMADNAWIVACNGDNPGFLLLSVYTSLLGSLGCQRELHQDELEEKWEDAKRLHATALRLKDEWR